MPIKILMPALSPTMKQGKIAKWNVKTGSKVSIGEVVAEIETDKAIMEFETVEEGIMGPILIPEGHEAKVGELIGWILEDENDTVPEDSPMAETVVAPKSETTEPQETEISVAKEPIQEHTFGKNAFSSPAARARAKELGVSIEEMINSGITHKIKDKDVVEYAAKSEQQLQKITHSESVAKLSGMQSVIAARMTEAKTTVPHFYLETLVCVDRLLELQAICREKDLKLTLTHGLIKCIAQAMVEVREMNVSWHQGALKKHGSIDIAVAVSLDNDGLITPIIPNTDTLNLRQLVAKMSDLVERARNNKLLPHEYQGGSLTISNLGMYGIDSFYPIMNLPQASILGVGAAREELYLENDLIKTRKVCSITMSADHRVINGATAARFMQQVKSFVENPTMILV